MKPKTFYPIIVISIILLSAPDLLACSCDGGLTFCEATTGTENDLIVAGEITYVDSTKLRLKIIDTFKGKEDRDTITIWSGTDFYCTDLFSMSTIELGEKGDSIIIILPQIDSTNIENDWDVIGDYRRPYYLCITPCLRLENDTVWGAIKDRWPMPQSTILSTTYENFKELWHDEQIDCSELVGTDFLESTDVDLCMGNNKLVLENYNALDLTINIFDHFGHKIQSISSTSDRHIVVNPTMGNSKLLIVQVLENNRLIMTRKLVIRN